MDIDTISDAILATFENRDTGYQLNHPVFTREFATDVVRNQQWTRFLKRIKLDESLIFEEVMLLITSRLQAIYEKLNKK